MYKICNSIQYIECILLIEDVTTMEHGKGAFIQEKTLYDYMNYRFLENSLRLKPIYINGKLYQGKKEYVNVKGMEKIQTTTFPDVKAISFDGISFKQAEIKFLTSKFNYHNPKNKDEYINYENFKNKKGFIITLKHDTFPRGLLEDYLVDIYELDRNDFIAFARENFQRLLYQQIHIREYSNVWFMYAGEHSNLLQSKEGIKSAIDSGLWCGTSYLSELEFAEGDTVVFFNTKNAGRQDVKNYLNKGELNTKPWLLVDFFITKVKRPYTLRSEYCIRNNIPYETQLWVNDPGKIDEPSGKFIWTKYNYIFEFALIQELRQVNLNLYDYYDINREFVEVLLKAYDRSYALMQHDTYSNALTYMLGIINHLPMIHNNLINTKSNIMLLNNKQISATT